MRTTPLVTARSLASLLTLAQVAALAGPRSYARGLDYYDDGRVELGTATDDNVEAVVRGTMPYRVVFRVRGRTVDWSCTCPVGEDGSFCKHCVAVALSLQPGEDTKQPVDGVRVAPWPRVYADLRTTGVRGEEAAEHLREVTRGG